MCHFYEGSELYASHQSNQKLQPAIQEARIMLLGDENVNECLVCRIQKNKNKMQALEQKRIRATAVPCGAKKNNV